MQLKEESPTVGSVTNLIGYLQDSSQFTPAAQVVESDRKIPTQQWRKGKPKELLQWEGSPQDTVDLEAFAAILRSDSVCAWGECHRKKKPAV
jgi:hypothetical protein